MKDTTVYKRGQVWFLKENEVRSGSIQYRSRPYLVVSNDICNTYSSVIHMAPITSQDKKRQPTHVTYLDNRGGKSSKNTILLEQIMPKSVPHIIRNSNYMYTLSKSVMDEVDKAISSQFALIENLHVEEDNPSEEYIDFLENQLDDTVLASMEVAPTSEESNEKSKSVRTQIEKFNRRVEKYKDINGIKEKQSSGITRNERGRIIWTDELKKEFLEDFESQGIDYLISKYGIGRSTCYKKLSKFKSEFPK